MPLGAGYITRDELLGITDRLRLDVSETQLVRWHKAGLLPRPTRHSLGRGQGTESRYPAVALSQVLAITWFFQQHRRLEEVRWALWCFGFGVTEGVRADLLKRLETWHAALLRGYRDFSQDRKPNLIDDLAFGRSPAWFGSRAARWARRKRRLSVALALSYYSALFIRRQARRARSTNMTSVTLRYSCERPSFRKRRRLFGTGWPPLSTACLGLWWRCRNQSVSRQYGDLSGRVLLMTCVHSATRRRRSSGGCSQVW